MLEHKLSTCNPNNITYIKHKNGKEHFFVTIIDKRIRLHILCQATKKPTVVLK